MKSSFVLFSKINKKQRIQMNIVVCDHACITIFSFVDRKNIPEFCKPLLYTTKIVMLLVRVSHSDQNWYNSTTISAQASQGSMDLETISTTLYKLQALLSKLSMSIKHPEERACNRKGIKK
jgi:hypothetical protein